MALMSFLVSPTWCLVLMLVIHNVHASIVCNKLAVKEFTNETTKCIDKLKGLNSSIHINVTSSVEGKCTHEYFFKGLAQLYPETKQDNPCVDLKSRFEYDDCMKENKIYASLHITCPKSLTASEFQEKLLRLKQILNSKTKRR